MNPEVRPIDGRHLLMKAKLEIEALMKQKEKTVEVDVTTILPIDFNSNVILSDQNKVMLFTRFCSI